LVPTDSITKRDLIAREADLILGEGDYGAVVTLKHGLMIPTAGIDESNSETGDYILYPRDPFASAERIWRQLREVFGLEKLGVIITDSHSRPFRRGVTGIALSYWGLNGGRSLIGEPDIFGRPLKHTFVDVVDSLAAAAVLMMGEAADRCPLAYLRKAPVEFCEDGRGQAVAMKPEDDMYFPLFRPKRNSR
jgi:coenzyme F420-0:L-glutamate ligase